MAGGHVIRLLAKLRRPYYKGVATMAIKLRVISDHYRELGENRARVFGVNGGTIGRAPDNDWVLPDPKRIVSGHHCEIDYRNGAYWLRDTSTNGVYVNEAEESVATTGPVELQDGDRLRLGDYELIVSVYSRIDFLPAAHEEHSAAKHLDDHIGAELDVETLFTSPDADASGSLPMKNVFGQKLQRVRGEARGRDAEAGAVAPADEPPPTPDWALSTRAITRQELADAMARRQGRLATHQQAQPFHQQANAWEDLQSAVQAFCRGAGLDPGLLSADAQSMLPLVAGQLLREAVVGLTDLSRSRAQSTPAASAHASASNPLRGSSGTDEALVRLFESHGRMQGGPVDSLRDVLQESKDHEAAVQAGLRAGLDALLGQLSPSSVQEQFEGARARSLAPGQDPAARYWEHYADLHRLLSQGAANGLPLTFSEAYERAYARARDELRAGGRESGGG
jgi:type VI secretion system protein